MREERMEKREGLRFVWQDGIIIEGMKEGKTVLLDEISLAEDSVLERLNPLFEEDRSLTLNDCGSEGMEVTLVILRTG